VVGHASTEDEGEGKAMNRAPNPDPSDDRASTIVGMAFVGLALAWCIAYVIIFIRAWLF
jgi:hypothetical protein